MDGLNRSPEQLRHLLLRLVQFLSDGHEFFAVHGLLQEIYSKTLGLYATQWHKKCHNVGCMSTKKLIF